MMKDGGGAKGEGGLEFTFIKIESCACLLVLPSSVNRSWKSRFEKEGSNESEENSTLWP